MPTSRKVQVSYFSNEEVFKKWRYSRTRVFVYGAYFGHLGDRGNAPAFMTVVFIREVKLEGIIGFLFVVWMIFWVSINLHEAGLLIPIVGAICAIGFVILLLLQIREGVRKKAEKKAANEREKAEEKAAEERRKIDAQKKASNLNLIVDQADNEIANIPKHLEQSEAAIRLAFQKLQSRSFYPFWDCMADAVENLQNYKNAINHLDSLRAAYVSALAQYKPASNSKDVHVIKSFPANSNALPALRTGSETASRIDQLYEIAHSDFEFSNIYANWRTNRTLVEGFNNVSNGLHAIRGELENISFTLIDGFDSVTSAVNDSSNQIFGGINDLTATVERQSDEIASYQAKNVLEGNNGFARSEKQDEMIRLLKNIQYSREDISTISDIEYYTTTRAKQ